MESAGGVWDEIALYFKKISQALDKKMNALVREMGLTVSQCRVLQLLWQSGGSAPFREAEERLGSTHATVSGIVKRMEKSGYVRTEPDEGDRRAKRIRLDERASALFMKADELKNDMLRVLDRTLSERQKHDLLGCMKIILNNITGADNA